MRKYSGKKKFLQDREESPALKTEKSKKTAKEWQKRGSFMILNEERLSALRGKQGEAIVPADQPVDEFSEPAAEAGSGPQRRAP